MPKSYVAKQEYFLKSAPETVFEALVKPKMLTKWFLSKAKLEPRKGGTFSFDWYGGYHMTDKVKKFDMNRTVSLS